MSPGNPLKSERLLDFTPAGCHGAMASTSFSRSTSRCKWCGWNMQITEELWALTLMLVHVVMYFSLRTKGTNRIRLRSTSSRWSWQSGWQRKQKRCPIGFRVFQTWSASAKSRSMQLVCHQIGWRHVAEAHTQGRVEGACPGELGAVHWWSWSKRQCKVNGDHLLPTATPGTPTAFIQGGGRSQNGEGRVNVQTTPYIWWPWHVFFQCVRAWYASRVGKGKKCVSASAAAVPLVCACLAVHVWTGRAQKNTYTGIRKPDSRRSNNAAARMCQTSTRCSEGISKVQARYSTTDLWTWRGSDAAGLSGMRIFLSLRHEELGTLPKSVSYAVFLFGKEGSPSQNLIEHSPQRYGTWFSSWILVWSYSGEYDMNCLPLVLSLAWPCLFQQACAPHSPCCVTTTSLDVRLAAVVRQ